MLWWYLIHPISVEIVGTEHASKLYISSSARCLHVFRIFWQSQYMKRRYFVGWCQVPVVWCMKLWVQEANLVLVIICNFFSRSCLYRRSFEIEEYTSLQWGVHGVPEVLDSKTFAEGRQRVPSVPTEADVKEEDKRRQIVSQEVEFRGGWLFRRGRKKWMVSPSWVP
jgi:hypothetical protein